MSNLKHIGKTVLNHDLEVRRGDISGSNASTGSVGRIEVSGTGSFGRIEATVLDPKGLPTGTVSGSTQTKENLPVGVISGSAQITSGSGGLMSGSVQTKENLPRGVVSSSAQITSGSAGLMSGSVQTKENLPTGTVSASMGVSGSSTSTGSFGKVIVSEMGNSDLTNVSSSIASRTTTIEGSGTIQGVGTTNAVTFATVDTGQGANELYDMDQNVLTTSNVTFADVTATGTVTAQEFHSEFVSSSILFTSGSTIFGNTGDDVAKFSGSLIINSGSDGIDMLVISSSGVISGSAITTGSFSELRIAKTGSFGRLEATVVAPKGLPTGTVSGSAQTKENLPRGVVSSSAQITSGSAGLMSGSVQTKENLPTGVISGSAQMTSGSVGLMSGSVQTKENLPRGVVSSSAQITSGSVGLMSGSIQTKENLPTGTISASMGISGSATSTGSFGRTETTTLNLSSINGNWTNAGNTVADLGSITTVDINGGTINGITDLAVADGGTGASTLTDGGVLLGSGTSAITAMSVLADSEMIVGDGSTDPVAESGATLRTSIGVGTTDNVLFAAISASGDISGSSTSTGSFGKLEVAGNSSLTGDLTIGGNITIGDADSDSLTISADLTSNIVPNADSTYNIGSTSKNWKFGYIEQLSATHITASANISASGTITANQYGGNISGSSLSTGSFGRTETTTLNLSSINGNWTNVGNTVADGGTFTTIDINGGTINGITDLAVADGGTGASTLTDGGVLLGSGTGAITAMSVLADSEMIVGDGSTDPVAESGATLRTSIGVGTTDNVLFAAVSASGDISGSSTSTGSFGRVEGSTLQGTIVTPSQTNITSVGTIGTGVWNSTFGAASNTTISGSLGTNASLIRTLTAAGVSGSFTTVSSSLASRLTSEEGEAEGSVVSSSAQIASDISGSFSKEHLGSKVANVVTSSAQIASDISGSLGSNASLIRTLTAASISGSYEGGGSTKISGSSTSTGSFGKLIVATDINPGALPTGTMSGSAQTKENLPTGVISGSGNLSASLPPGTMSGSVQTKANLPRGVVSSSAQITSGSVGLVSGSAQTKANLPRGVVSSSAQITSGSGGLMSGSVQTKENLPRGVISGSAQITSGSVGLVSGSAQTIAHLPTGTISASMGISGSVTSTGSFGKLEVAGNSSLTGDLTIGGNITIGDADTDSLTISADLTSNLIPNADSTYNIGSTSKNWKFGYIEQLSATHVTASGNISGSASSTGSFAQILVGGSDGSNAFAVVSASKASGNIQISGSIQSTGSFGRVEATRLKGDGSELTNIAALPFVKTGSYYSDNDSDIYITGSLYVTGAVSASAIDAGYGQKHIHTQSTAATTWTVTHNFGEQFVNVDVYNASNQIVIPQSITATDGNTITVTFPTVTAGYAVVSTGGQHGPGAGKNYKHSQTSTATNWSVTHSLGEQYPTVTVWDKEDNVIVPDQIIARDASKADIIFAELQSGYAMFSVGGSATGMFTFTGSVASVANDVTITGSLRATNYGDNVSGSSTSTGSFGYLNVDGDAVIGGNLTFGDADTDSVSFSAEINSNIVPDADSTYNIGSTSKNWKFGHIEQLSATHVTASGNISGSATTTGSFGKLVIGGTTEPVFQVISGSNAVSTVSGSILISGSALSTGSFGKLVVATEINPGALPTGVMSGSAQTKENLPAGVISGSAGLSGSLPRGVISGSAQITSGSAGLMSGSAQTKENLPTGVISGSGNLSASLPPGTMSGSAQTKENLPRGVISGSAQITSGSVGLVSGSAQTIAHLPTGTVSASMGVSGSALSTGSFGYVIGVSTGSFQGVSVTNKLSAGTLSITGDATVDGNATVGGTLTAQEFHTEFVSSSVLLTSGSTIFGNTGDDVAKFSGSLLVNSASNNILVVSSSGRVGIGTFNPSAGTGNARLHVYGDILVESGSAKTMISGSSTSTGSFGRLEAKKISGSFIGDGTFNNIDDPVAMAIALG